MAREKNFKTNIEEHISKFIGTFLLDQLGEKITSVQTFFHNHIIVIIAKDCLTTGEKRVASNAQHTNQLFDYKARQFDQVKSELHHRLEGVMKRKIDIIDSIIERHGVRYIFITLAKNQKPIITKESQYA